MHGKVFYSEEIFVIDLIMSAYKTRNINTIVNKAKTDLGTNLTKSVVYDYLNHTEDFETQSSSIKMNEFFKENIYEQQ